MWCCQHGVMWLSLRHALKWLFKTININTRLKCEMSKCESIKFNNKNTREMWNDIFYHKGIVSKIFRKTSISYPLIRIRTCLYQGVKNVCFLETFACALNDSWIFCCNVLFVHHILPVSKQIGNQFFLNKVIRYKIISE